MIPSRAVTPRQAAALSSAVGFLAASQTVLWVRVIGSAGDNRPEAFAHALGACLAGGAVGARVGLALRRRVAAGTLRFAALMAAASAVMFHAAMPMGAALMARDASAGQASLLAAAVIAAAALGAILPALCESSVEVGAADGSEVARVVVAVLFGAALGPLVTGYVLLDVESIEHVILMVALAGLGLAQALWLAAPERRRRAGVTVFSLAALGALMVQREAFASFLERVHFGPGSRQERYATVTQGRGGVVGVTPDGREYRDGLYDGAFTIDSESAAPSHGRAFFVPALHRAPRTVLLIGLGTGAWARVLAAARGVESLTIVESNPAILDAVWHHPGIATVLDDPRVRLHLDDARRWLVRNPARRFDVIVVAAPWHWRSGATNVLSAEFLRTLKAHLAQGGVAYFNTTSSLDALYTASGVWRHVMRVSSFAAASDAPFDQTPDERRAAMLTVLGADGAPLIRGANAERALAAMLEQASGELAPALRRANDLWNITDDNMASEFKATGAGRWWRALPERVWRPDRAWPTILF